MTKTIAEIVNETLAYYEEDPSRRATNSIGDCMYIDDSGRMCAARRALLAEAPHKGDRFALMFSEEIDQTNYIERKPIMRKTKKEIIDETVAFYEEDPTRRALDKHGLKCQYITADGRNCAVGRCLTDEVLEEIENSCENLNFMGVGPLGLETDRGDSMFKEEYRGHEVSFWAALQIFHDGPSYWNTITTATSAGARAWYVAKLHAEWDNAPGLEEQS